LFEKATVKALQRQMFGRDKHAIRSQTGAAIAGPTTPIGVNHLLHGTAGNLLFIFTFTSAAS